MLGGFLGKINIKGEKWRAGQKEEDQPVFSSHHSVLSLFKRDEKAVSATNAKREGVGVGGQEREGETQR